jgi:hypothetical protein
MKYSINSRIAGKKLTFSRPGRGYIWIDFNGGSGILGYQICDKGSLMGSTIAYYGDDQSEFDAICKKWYRAHMSKKT